MTKEFCDICGREITNYSEVSDFKLKKRVYSWHESWWGRMRVHTRCWEDLCEQIENSRKNHPL